MQKYYQCKKCNKPQTSHGPILLKNCNNCKESLRVIKEKEYRRLRDKYKRSTGDSTNYIIKV